MTDVLELLTLESLSLAEFFREAAVADPAPRTLDRLLDDHAETMAAILRPAVKQAASGKEVPFELLNDRKRQQLVDLFMKILQDAAAIGRLEVRAREQEILSQRGLAEGISRPLLVPHVRQSTNYSCGRAAMLSVLKYRGMGTQGTQHLDTNPEDGTSAGSIVSACERLGLAVEAREGATLADLAHATGQGAPCLCAVTMYGGGHWIVVVGIGDDGAVRIVDPNADIPMYAMPVGQFMRIWTDGDEGFDQYAIAIGERQEQADVREEISLSKLAVDYIRSLVPVPGKDVRRQTTPIPAIASTEEIESSIQAGDVVLYRGMPDPAQAAATRTGVPYIGDGDYGKGIYASTSEWQAAGYAGEEGDVVRMTMSPKAKTISLDEITRLHNAAIDAGQLTLTVDENGITRVNPDIGTYAKQLGYDAIVQPSRAYVNIVNPAVLTVENPVLVGPSVQAVVGDFRRQAFTLAATTEQAVLDSVQSVLADVLTTGRVAGVPEFPGGPRLPSAAERVQMALDAAGLGDDPAYARMVTRTNLMDAYNQGLHDELQSSDMFPVWMYSNPDDIRSRPHHAEKDRKYYPKTVPFVQVRGTGPEDACNCRCVPIPIDKFTWAELKAAGARIAVGYADVPAEPTLYAQAS